MIERFKVTLECCKTIVEVTFDHTEAPALPKGYYRKNVSCPNCDKLVIVDLKIDQEVIKVGEVILLVKDEGFHEF